MLNVNEVIIVEGKYDKIKISQIVDGLIVDVGGFSIFTDEKKMNFIKDMTKKFGILILTDSDSAGFMIRNYINGCCVSKGIVKHAYIPDIYGKERRKLKASKEGKLGVEGVPNNILIDVISNAVLATENDFNKNIRTISKTDFYNDGLSGQENSELKRKMLLKYLNLPEHLSQNVLLRILNKIISYDDYCDIINKLDF